MQLYLQNVTEIPLWLTKIDCPPLLLDEIYAAGYKVAKLW